jgi:hypothetical protein
VLWKIGSTTLCRRLSGWHATVDVPGTATTNPVVACGGSLDSRCAHRCSTDLPSSWCRVETVLSHRLRPNRLPPPLGHIGMMSAVRAPEILWTPIAAWLRAQLGTAKAR